jgi:hypothetical protein
MTITHSLIGLNPKTSSICFIRLIHMHQIDMVKTL